MNIWQFLQEPNSAIYKTGTYVVLDFETTNLEKGDFRNPDNKLICAVWYTSWTKKYKRIYGNEYQVNQLLKDIDRADFIVAHSTQFELGWLIRCGADLHNLLPWCTMIGEYVLAGNRRWPLSLEATCARYDIPVKQDSTAVLVKAGVCPSQIPPYRLVNYCYDDVKATVELFEKQRELVFEAGLENVVLTRNLFTPVLVDIKQRGMQLDSRVVQELYQTALEEKNKLERTLIDLVGEINWNSPQQLANLLYYKLKFKELTNINGQPIRNKPSKAYPEGQPLTDSKTLASLKATTRKQQLFLETYKQLAKTDDKLSKYLKKFKQVCEETDDHIIKSNFHQTVTRTHRLSSSDPNFQNFDRTLKKVFTTRDKKNYEIGEADQRQLEFRTAAYLGQCSQAIDDIRRDVDIHSFTASVIGVTRQEAKSDTFKPLYGGTSGTKEQRQYYEAFKKKYIGITQAQDDWVREALTTGRQKTCTGLVYYWPDVRVTPSGYIQGNTNVRNYPIQMLATADIVPIGVVYLWHRMYQEKMKSYLINTVHDSAIGEIYKPEKELFKKISVQAMVDDTLLYLKKVYQLDFNVPLEIEFKFGSHWG